MKGSRKKVPKEEAPTRVTQQQVDGWDALCLRASRVIEEITAQLPPDVALEAKKVPYLFREHAEKESEGYRTMGEYQNFIPGRKSAYEGPIFLYLKTIAEFCMENGEDFDAEVQTTYLHELGHHFGWDEVDLARHGLPSGRKPGE